MSQKDENALYSDSESEAESETESILSNDDEKSIQDLQEDDVEEKGEEGEGPEEDGNEYENDSEDENEVIPDITGGAIEDNEDDEDEEDDTHYLQKFNSEINKNYIVDFHPECCMNNYDEISVLTRVVRDKTNNIIDNLHKTIPFLTKYERTRIIGQRAKQINSGANAFVKVPENIIDGYLIAELELSQKRIPFMIRRPIPGGGCEYWSLKDLEIVSF